MIIGTGVDITEVKRMRQAIEKWGDSFFINKILHKNGSPHFQIKWLYPRDYGTQILTEQNLGLSINW